MSNTKFFSLIAALSLPVFMAGSAQAQQVTLYGEIEDVQGTQNQFFLKCANVQLRGNTINLNPFNNQFVKLTGMNTGTPASPSVLVDSIQMSPQVVNVGGERRPGTQFEIDVFAAPGTQYGLLVSTGISYLPLGQFGTFFMDGSAVFIGGATIGSLGQAQWILPIPNDTTLIGLELFSQALVAPGGFAPFVSNMDCKEIRS